MYELGFMPDRAGLRVPAGIEAGGTDQRTVHPIMRFSYQNFGKGFDIFFLRE